ncbi:hypothetical protein A6V39_00060 [Candidatus Mycoplasma haematobovis]|uniref:Uncharacterized protein n=1 Tax=Candidatus Mycoplasma haematobovis TaxID=432608 RepID=A0A1A9QCX8_9MOLU|nr:hypothetical protein A6V39_00060 [Candidatus Mycoplasma haematobovis]
MAVSTVIIIASLAYKASPLVIYQTTNKDYLNSLGYQYLGDNHKFNQWKTNYSLFKKSLSKSVSIFEHINDDLKGAYLLKRWCDKNVGASLSSQEDFKLVRKHCVVNLKNVILNSPTIKTIDDLDSDKRKQLLKNNKGICHSDMKELVHWCVNSFRMAHIPRNYGSLVKVKGCCSIDTSL